MEKRIDFIENSLQKGMEHLYKEGLNTKNADIIANCLRTYSAIDRVKEAERMFRVHIVHPFMVRVRLSYPPTLRSLAHNIIYYT